MIDCCAVCMHRVHHARFVCAVFSVRCLYVRRSLCAVCMRIVHSGRVCMRSVYPVLLIFFKRFIMIVPHIIQITHDNISIQRNTNICNNIYRLPTKLREGYILS